MACRYASADLPGRVWIESLDRMAIACARLQVQDAGAVAQRWLEPLPVSVELWITVP